MKNKVLRIFLIILFSLMIHTVSNAAISTNDPTVNSGENVTINVKSNVSVVSYKVLANNECGFSLVSSSGGAGEGSLTITGASDGDGVTNLATFVFKAPTVTKDTTYKMTFLGTIMEDKDFNAIADDSATATITVKAPVAPSENENNNSNNDNNNTNNSNEEQDLPTASDGGAATTVKSSNNYLKSLKISTGTISFNKKTTKYTINVTEETENITITATAEHEKAAVNGTGKIALQKGTNPINVVVTAENGSARNYQLIVVRPGEEIEEEEEEPEQETIGALTYLKLKGVKDSGEIIEILLTPEFSKDVFYYECEIPAGINFIDVEQASDILDAIVEVTGNENLVDGENLINIIIKYTDENNEEQIITYQISAKKQATAITQEIIEEEQGLSSMQIGVIAGGIVIILIIITILVVKHRRQQNEMDFGGYGEPFYSEDDEIFEEPIPELKIKEEKEQEEYEGEITKQQEVEEDEIIQQEDQIDEWEEFEPVKKKKIFGKSAKKGKHF